MEFNHFFFCLVTVACYWVTHNCLTLFVRNYLLALTDISNGILDPELELNSNKKPQIVRHQNPIHTERKLKVVFKHTAIKCAWGGNRSHHSSAVVRPIFRSGSPQCRPHTHTCWELVRAEGEDAPDRYAAAWAGNVIQLMWRCIRV